jgi:hypothetical protein
MKTLDDAMNVLLRLNGLVEHYALQIKRNQQGGTFLTNIKRQLPALSEMLKAQFGMIADLVMQTSLAARGRGADQDCSRDRDRSRQGKTRPHRSRGRQAAVGVRTNPTESEISALCA